MTMVQQEMLVLMLLAVVAGLVAYSVWRGRRQSTIFEQVERVTSQVNELALRVVELEMDRAGYRLWTAQLRGQIVELGHTPIPPPPWLVVSGGALGGAVTEESILVTVYNQITKYFSLEEIDDLAFRAGIAADAFGGKTQPGRAKELVEHAVRHGKLSKLMKEARRLRPSVDWPYVTVIDGQHL